MATLGYVPTRRVILTALTRVFGSRSLVILITLVIGAILFVWARIELAAMFERNETGEMVVGVVDADPGCVAPSLYLAPDMEQPGSYLAVLDMFGGGLADPSIMNVGRPRVAVAVGAGEPLAGARAGLADCRRMAFRLPGRAVALSPAEDGGRTNVPPSAFATLTPEGDATILRFDLPADAEETAGRTAVRIDGIADAWQYGYRRLNLWNRGRSAVRVILLDTPGYAFLSGHFDPMQGPVRGRSVVAGTLAPPGLSDESAFQVYSRLVDYEGRLQARLLTVSTVFGIGISLLVEGTILLLLKLARRLSPEAPPADDRREPGRGGG